MQPPILTTEYDSQILHPGSRRLFAHWESLRAERAYPDREEFTFEPVKDLMPDIVVLERGSVRGSCRFRLAGSRVCALFGRNLTGTDALSGWDAYEANVLSKHFELAFGNSQPVLIRMRLLTNTGMTLATELIAMPIRARGSNRVQLIGGLFSFRDTADLSHQSIQARELAAARAIWTEHGGDVLRNFLDVTSPLPDRPSSRPVLRVLEGGKSR